MRHFIFFIMLLSTSVGFSYSIPQQVREGYGQKMHEAFCLQSLGRSSQAFWKSKEAYEEAIKAGESPYKLEVVLELFRWYRKYGYGAGVMVRSSECTDEYVPQSNRNRAARSFRSYSHGNSYNSEWGKNPEQAKYIRQFMLGVGMFISGTFMIALNPPVLGATAGRSLCITGFVQMYSGLSNGWAEWEQRVKEIQKVELKAQKLTDTN
jgi:hypothetical protein